jgi:hypothetical protein
MAEGQIKKDVIKKARKTPAKPAETTKVEESDDPNSQASTETPTSSEQPSTAFLDVNRGVRNKKAKEEDRGISLLNKNVEETTRANLERTEAEKLAARTPAELDVELDKAFAQMDADAAKQQLRERRGIASDLKDLSKRGALTSDLLKEARQKAEKAGVTGEQFESFMEKNRIRERGSPFSFKRQKSGTGLFDQPAPSPEAAARATQKVLYEREFGTEPLSMQKAMQSEDYVTGSYSQNLFKSRPLSGRKSSAYEREARRAKRKGDKALASGLRAKAAEARVGQASIDTPALKKGRRDAEIAAGEEAILQDKVFSETMRRAAESDARLRDMQQPRRLR